MLCCYLSYGIILTLVPDLSDSVGIQNRGTFFTIFTLSSLSTRFFAGKISDQHGRVPVLKVSAWLLAISMLLFAHTHTPEMLYLSSALFGIANGVFSPAINAWTVDLGDPQRKGRSMATMYIALELAIGSGAWISGAYFANDMARMPAVFYFAGILCVMGWFYLQFFWKKVPPPT